MTGTWRFSRTFARRTFSLRDRKAQNTSPIALFVLVSLAISLAEIRTGFDRYPDP